ncbi:uncharacterized protein LOC142329994 [Lycorma delicatula]|uniref:uncharacterized protein LOC142329994 n=1 Tax=Lycorma delicatula TaxID=130591 RepID=UPI003F510D20
MGTKLSVQQRESTPDPWWPNQTQTEETASTAFSRSDLAASSTQVQNDKELAIAVATAVANAAGVTAAHMEDGSQVQINDIDDDFNNDSRLESNQKKLEVFKQELATKREARQKAISALTDKLKQLQQQVKAEEQSRIIAENEVTRLKELLKERGLKEELDKERLKVASIETELENERKLRLELEKEKEDAQEKEHQIRALREVASIGKEMLRIRELQVNELKKKLCETQYPEDLREEYETQIQNVKRLKNLYEERAEAVRLEHQREIEKEVARIRLLENKISELERERSEAEFMREHLKDRVLKLDQELEERNDAAMSLQEQLDASVIECRDLASQMNLINNLFSQILVGNLDLDHISRIVEENQRLVTDLTSDDKKNDLAALLIDIAKQIDDNLPNNTINDSSETEIGNSQSNTAVINNNNSGMMTQHDVALNLSKVWRILVQLLTQDNISSSPLTECDSESCYKSVETPSGKRSVISVSQTFLTLKNLILEKNALIKEVNKLKLLNEHLETRLGNQEKRLSIVSTELKKTWGVVNKLRVQHKQLHTQETILKYELQHKRLLLNDLKDELERCKEIWDMARKKNCQSEEEWRKLRKEFADRRKNRLINNSAESGYEDEESNSTPTEDSIDEQELDRIINRDSENVNGDLMISSIYVNKIHHTEHDNNYENNEINSDDSDPNDYDFASEQIKSTDNYEFQNEVVQEGASGQNTDEISKQSTEENKIEEEEKESVILKDTCKSECTENEMKLIEDKNETESASTSHSSAENISKFLEGLLTVDEMTVSNNNEVKTCENEDIQVKSDDFSVSVIPMDINNEQSDLPVIINSNVEIHLNVTNVDEELNYSTSYSMNQSKCTAQTENDMISLKNVTKCASDNSVPHTSSTSDNMIVNNDNEVKDKKLSNENRTTEEVLDARTERLKKLEEQCKSLFNKVTATTIKSNVLSSKLELLHEQYGRSTDSVDDNSNSTVTSSTFPTTSMSCEQDNNNVNADSKR